MKPQIDPFSEQKENLQIIGNALLNKTTSINSLYKFTV